MKSIQKLVLLFALAICSSTGLFAQFQGQNCDPYNLGLDPADPLTPYYVWMCQQTVASPGMLPPPGGIGGGQQYNICPPIPPDPGYKWMLTGIGGGLFGWMRVYPYLVAHTYPNTPAGCTEYTWEYDPNYPF